MKKLFFVALALVSVSSFANNIFRIWINEKDYDYMGFRRVKVATADGYHAIWSEYGFVDVDTPKDSIEMVINGDYHMISSDTIIYTSI